MQLNLHHVFDHDGGSCLIDPENMRVQDIAADTAALVRRVARDPSGRVSSEEAHALRSLGLLDEQPSPYTPDGDFAVMKIALFVAQDCNLRCTYCYGGEGGTYGSKSRMSRQTALESVDWLFNNAGDNEVVSIGFFGGEPLLAYELIKEVVGYGRDKAIEHGIRVRFSITTNASLLTDEKVAFLKDNDVHTTVSFDGPKEVQDRQRPLPQNVGSYDKVVPRIKKLLKVLPDSPCRATVTDGSEMAQIERGIREVGFTNAHLTSVSGSLFEWNRDDSDEERDLSHLRLRAEEEARALQRCLRERDLQGLERIKQSGTWGRKIFRFASEFMIGKRRHYPCGAGRYYVGIGASGDVYPCHRFVGTESTKLGSVADGEVDRSEFNETSMAKGVSCADCYAKHVCSGGCYHDNFGKTGDLFDPDSTVCHLIRHVVGLAASLASQWTHSELAFLSAHELIDPIDCSLDMFSDQVSEAANS